jgi:hypothetical protein
MEKQIMMLVQAAPKTQPGGVQGAFDRFKYQSVFGPLFMSQLPNANPPKLMNRNKIKYLIFLIITFFLRIQFFLISDLLQHTFDH